jgi:hypothetical protein
LERQVLDEPTLGQRAIHALAFDLIKSPTDFAEHLAWLTSDEAEDRFRLFFTLGVQDHERELLESLLAHHEGGGWPRAFGGYVSGWSTVAASQADALLDQLADSRPELHAGVLHATASLPASPAGVDRILRLAVSTAPSRAIILRDLAAPRWNELAAADFERLVRGLDDGTPETRYLLLWPFLSRLVGQVLLPPPARELAWSFLRATIATPEARRGHQWDFVGAELGKSDPARLLELIGSVMAGGSCDPRSLWLTDLKDAWPSVWEVLMTHDRPSLVRRLLQAAMESNLPHWGESALEEATLRPDEDSELLLQFADDGGVKAARIVASVLDPSRPGFWQVARRLLATWGADEVVPDRLLSSVLSGSYEGSAVPMVTERLTSARALLSDANPHVVRWAGEVVESLEDWKRRAERDDSEEWIWDTRIKRAELEGMLKREGSSERLWAIARLLEDAPESRVKELLAPDEILEALPHLPQLDGRRRRVWEGWARHWSGRGEHPHGDSARVS